MNNWVIAVLSVPFLLGACNDEKDDYVRPSGRGSTACQAWQKSICDFVVQCSDYSEVDCVDNYYGVTCASDAQAQTCATALASATCAAPPSSCDLSDIADRTPAVTACNAFVGTMCQRAVDCGAMTLEACTAEVNSSLDCSLAIAFTTNYETCISETQVLTCSESSIPDACNDVIKLMPIGTP